jgi:hypothetical protein
MFADAKVEAPALMVPDTARETSAPASVLLSRVVVVTAVPLGSWLVSASVPLLAGMAMVVAPELPVITDWFTVSVPVTSAEDMVVPPRLTPPDVLRVVNDAGRVLLSSVVVVTTVPDGSWLTSASVPDDAGMVIAVLLLDPVMVESPTCSVPTTVSFPPTDTLPVTDRLLYATVDALTVPTTVRLPVTVSDPFTSSVPPSCVFPVTTVKSPTTVLAADTVGTKTEDMAIK